MSSTEALLEDIAADVSSFARMRKMEFGVDFHIAEGHLGLLRQARLVYDETDDVPHALELSINALFDEVFDREVKAYLT